jgi:hypothetical protein
MQAVIGQRTLVDGFSRLDSLRDLADLAKHLR